MLTWTFFPHKEVFFKGFICYRLLIESSRFLHLPSICWNVLFQVPTVASLRLRPSLFKVSASYAVFEIGPFRRRFYYFEKLTFWRNTDVQMFTYSALNTNWFLKKELLNFSPHFPANVPCSVFFTCTTADSRCSTTVGSTNRVKRRIKSNLIAAL